MVTTLLVPGLDGSSGAHWQTWWQETEAGARMVDLPDPARPRPRAWEEELAGIILLNPGAVLVGHSLGAILIARLLTIWPQAPVAGAVLVAPAETTGHDRIAHFGPIPENSLPVPSRVVLSRDDPWMGFARGAALARAWGADAVDLGLAGHINVASGFGPWPEGKRLRDDLLNRPRDARLPRKKIHHNHPRTGVRP